MVSIKQKTRTCKQCGHSWRARKVISFQCPHCKSTKWNKQKEYKGVIRND